MTKNALTSADEGALYQKNRLKINQNFTDVCTATANLVSDQDVVQNAIAGLASDDLEAGKKYQFEIVLKTAMTTNGGIKLCHDTTNGGVISGLVSIVEACTASAIAVTTPTSIDDAGDAFIDSKAAANILLRINGSFTCETKGDFIITAAQNTSHADETTVYAGSTMRLWTQG